MKTILLALSLSCTFQMLAQLNCSDIEYQISSFEEAYEEINVEDAIDLTQGYVWDDPEFSIELGFPFTYFSFETEAAYLSGDLLGAAIIMNPEVLQKLPTAMLILPAFSDYTDLAYAEFEEGTENGISSISHVTEGDEGNRIFKLQWKDVGFYEEVSEGTANNFMNVQLWLYEVDGAIEFRFGPSNIEEEDSQLVFDGGTSPVSSLICSFDFNSQEIIGTAATNTEEDPELADINAVDFPMLDEIASDGRVLRWERSEVVSVSESIAPEFTVQPNPFSTELTLNSNDSFDSVEIVSLTGQTVIETALNNETVNLDVSHLKNGIYFLKASKGDKVVTRKLVKQ